MYNIFILFKLFLHFLRIINLKYQHFDKFNFISLN
jgi:hypothetical protein